ncbi:MAG TPA: right-handed parallel beta-helix repeat-containing protein [Candidatus Krumholzibacteria bacterium]|nr:right-handed parallel beta-helix repeat-containing protein [Candidatus Krumholzibacteria bacterium]
MNRPILLALILSMTAAQAATGTVRVVYPNGSGAYPNIQAALDASTDGDIVELADGVFTGSNNRDLDFNGHDIIVRSQSGDPETCIIDCEHAGRGFKLHSGESNDAAVQHIWIRNGNAGSQNGGGIYADDSYPTIEGNIISDCDALYGGGIFAREWTSESTVHSRIIGNVIRNNTARQGAAIDFGTADVYHEDPIPALIHDNVIVDNSAEMGTGGISLTTRTDGIFDISGCTIANNRSWTAASPPGGPTITLGNQTGWGHSILNLANTIIWLNDTNGITYGDQPECTGAITVDCCAIADGQAMLSGDWTTIDWGDHNILYDPLFCDPDSGDYLVAANSKCLPGHADGCPTGIGALGSGCGAINRTHYVTPDDTIQQAIDVSYSGDTIVMADGVYRGGGNRDLDCDGKKIELRSHSGNPYACIIDCQGSQILFHRGFDFHNGENGGCVLSGFSVINGTTGGNGGAVICRNGSSPIFENCVFRDCWARFDGGAVSCEQTSRPRFVECVFLENTAQDDGGAIMCRDDSNVILDGCTLALDSAGDHGGALYIYAASPVVTGCTVRACLAPTAGAAITTGLFASLTMQNTIIASCLVTAPMECVGTPVTLACCDIHGNEAGNWTGPLASQLGHNGNIQEDPLFCNPEAIKLTVRSDSPCAADNNPDCGQIGAWGVGCGSPPDIAVSPPSLAFDVAPGYTQCMTLTIDNTGGTNLHWSLSESSAKREDLLWLTASPTEGTVSPDASIAVEVCGEGNVDPGAYSATLIVTSDDPDEPTVEVPVTLYVGMHDILGVFTAHDGSGVNHLMVAPETPFDVYLTLADASHTEGLGGWEARLTTSANLEVQDWTYQGTGMSLGDFPGDFTVVFTTVVPWAETIWLGTIRAVLTDNDPGYLYLAPHQPPSIDPPAPCYIPWQNPVPVPMVIASGSPELPVFVVEAAPSRHYLVRPDGSGDYPTIQAAIDACAYGDVVDLVDGIYKGPGNRDLRCNGTAVTVHSLSGNPESCIIDCEADESSPHRAFDLQFGEGPDTIIEGVTITGAYMSSSAGMLISGASPTIRNCVFHQNSAANAAAIQIAANSSPLLEDCRFTDNHATVSGGAGAVVLSTPTFRRCSFAGNSCGNSGGALLIYQGSAILEYCAFFGNAGQNGGALNCGASPNLTAVNHCTFVSNTGVLGAMVCTSGGATPQIDNCILAFGLTGAAVHCVVGSTAALFCTDVYGNEGGDWVGYIADQAGTDGNLETDPQFCDWGAYNLMLQEDSPCAGQSWCGQIGAFGVGCGDVRYVAPDGSTAYPTIQAAVTAAEPGDIVALYPGIYRGLENRDVDTQGKAITIQGTGASRTDCVIDCESLGRAFYIHSDEGPATVVQGLTIENGHAVDGNGGAILCGTYPTDSASPTIRDCVFRNCIADNSGGAIWAVLNSDVTVENCVFYDNHALRYGGAWGNDFYSQPTVLSCTFFANTCEGDDSDGGGVYSSSGSLTIDACLLWGNRAEMGDQIGMQNSTVVSVDCSDVEGGLDGIHVEQGCDLEFGAGTIATDPLFCNGPARDLTLSTSSSCLPENNDCGLQMGAYGEGCEDPTTVPELDLLRASYLAQNAPNPFNPATRISFGLAEPSLVELCVYDLTGRRVRRLLAGTMVSAGEHTITWRGDDDHGRELAAGVYLYRLKAGDMVATRKMLLVK